MVPIEIMHFFKWNIYLLLYCVVNQRDLKWSGFLGALQNMLQLQLVLSEQACRPSLKRNSGLTHLYVHRHMHFNLSLLYWLELLHIKPYLFWKMFFNNNNNTNNIFLLLSQIIEVFCIHFNPESVHTSYSQIGWSIQKLQQFSVPT